MGLTEPSVAELQIQQVQQVQQVGAPAVAGFLWDFYGKSNTYGDLYGIYGDFYGIYGISTGKTMGFMGISMGSYGFFDEILWFFLGDFDGKFPWDLDLDLGEFHGL